jgi:hypothetical protein
MAGRPSVMRASSCSLLANGDAPKSGRRRPLEVGLLGSGDALAARRASHRHGADLGQASVGIDLELIDDAIASGLDIEEVPV